MVISGTANIEDNIKWGAIKNDEAKQSILELLLSFPLIITYIFIIVSVALIFISVI